MQKLTPSSVSIQREIERHRLNIESEIDKSMGKLGFRTTLLDRSGIRKEKGYAPISFRGIVGGVNPNRRSRKK
jgi:hypothetical protein